MNIIKNMWRLVVKPECPREIAGHECRIYRGHIYCNDCGRGVKVAN